MPPPPGDVNPAPAPRPLALRGGADPEQADETPTALALRQRIKAARQANIEQELNWNFKG